MWLVSANKMTSERISDFSINTSVWVNTREGGEIFKSNVGTGINSHEF